mmetsp:Transcript_10581/g.32541  ORF Transcript_10581/g.32541 Transcript_10581/m.32541 type:complete len:200 (+) Transcript_10581:117-716(+)
MCPKREGANLRRATRGPASTHENRPVPPPVWAAAERGPTAIAYSGSLQSRIAPRCAPRAHCPHSDADPPGTAVVHREPAIDHPPRTCSCGRAPPADGRPSARRTARRAHTAASTTSAPARSSSAAVGRAAARCAAHSATASSRPAARRTARAPAPRAVPPAAHRSSGPSARSRPAAAGRSDARPRRPPPPTARSRPSAG